MAGTALKMKVFCARPRIKAAKPASGPRLCKNDGRYSCENNNISQLASPMWHHQLSNTCNFQVSLIFCEKNGKFHRSCLNLLLHLLGCLHICCWNRWCLQQVHLTHQESPGGSNAGAKTRWVSSSGVREPHLDVESFSKLRKAINST